jgi:hypothetical protein
VLLDALTSDELAKLSAAGLAHSENAPDGSTVWWRDDHASPAGPSD